MTDFAAQFVSSTPADPDHGAFPRPVHRAAFSRVRPTPVAAPKLLAWSPEVAALLELAPEELRSTPWVEALGGNRLLPGMAPYAAAYGGHQFGNWAGQLGDGRAITLGERVTSDGRRYDLQLKGAGPTPYSRHADGRAVLRSSVREFVASEAMFHLGVPTTRALSLVTTGEDVERDMFYDGNPAAEPGAIVCRVSPHFLRFGSFELPARRGEYDLLRRLFRYTVDFSHPTLPAHDGEAALGLLLTVGEATITMITHWMRVGFVHGVMNTDNMSLLGLTLDYGPYGWLEPYEPGWTPNTTDAYSRRYTFGNQPKIALWNLTRLAEALVPLVGSVPPLQAVMEHLAGQMEGAMAGMWRRKLGLVGAEEADGALVGELLRLAEAAKLDYTLLFRALGDAPLPGPAPLAALEGAAYSPLSEAHRAALSEWWGRYAARVARDEGAAAPGPADRTTRMAATNPLYVPRNWLLFEAITRATEGDAGGVEELLAVSRSPYTAQPGRERYAEKRPAWAERQAGCATLSCSS